MTISPVKADVGITGINTKPTGSNNGCAQRLCQSFKVVEEMAPKFMNVGNITSQLLFRQDFGDRLFNLNEKAGIACLVDAQGSVDGSITCGTVDKY